MQRPCNFERFKNLLGLGGTVEDLNVIEAGNIVNPFKGKKFNNCNFNKSISFTAINIEQDVVFEKCSFEQPIYFTDVSFKTTLKLKDCSFSDKLVFVGCSFNELEVNGGTYKEIVFKGIIKELSNSENQISISTDSCEVFEIKTKEISCSINFNKAKISEIRFHKSQFKGAIYFDESSEIRDMHAQSCTFHDRMDFNAHFEGSIYFHKCNFDEQVVFNKICKANSLSFSNILSKQNVSLHYVGNIGSLDINGATFNSMFNCYCVENDEFTDDFSCDLAGYLHGNIVFEGIPIGSISVSGINFGNIIFNRVTTKLISITDFHNRNKLTISNISLNKKFNLLLIFDSNINQTEFVNIDFTKFSEVVVAKSDVSNMILSNSLFPKKIQIETIEPRLGYVIPQNVRINNYLYFRESYRQLKLAMERQGNRNEALHYKALEMQYLRRELSFGWDKLLLYLNYFSNNHGTSWVRGICFTFLVTFFFFCLYNSALDAPIFYWGINFTNYQIKMAFNDGLDAYMEYLASFPGLRLDITQSTKWQIDAIVILSRIFVGYGIFQTVVAFRKYGSSS